MTPREKKARQEDVIEQIQLAHERGLPLTVRGVGMTLYQRARRAFGSWTDAVVAAGFDPRDGAPTAYGDPTTLLRSLDAVSPNPLPGLPAYMRERQILGGRILERFARECEGDARILDDADRVVYPLLDAFYGELRSWHLEHKPEPVNGIVGARVTNGTVGAFQTYASGETTGGIDLPSMEPVDHGR